MLKSAVFIRIDRNLDQIVIYAFLIYAFDKSGNNGQFKADGCFKWAVEKIPK